MRELSATKQRLTKIAGLPPCSVGAPLPFVLASEDKLSVVYHVQTHHPDWDGTTVRMVDLDSTNEPVAVVRFHRPYAHLFGPPNDEAIGGHPLYALGLTAYSCFEVQASAWIADLRRRNAVHPHHRDGMFAAYRHFILTFHDSTLEVVTEGFEAELIDQASILSAAATMVEAWRDD